MKKAKGEIGVKEVPGSGSNPRISEYLASTTYGSAPDSVPWCSAYVNWVFWPYGTNSAAAISWESWGERLKSPKYGCVVVWPHHVGFYIGEGRDPRYGAILSGNSQDKVQILEYSLDNAVAYRWPVTKNIGPGHS
jgi:uncharacterized protein (TIGR02594 family)